MCIRDRLPAEHAHTEEHRYDGDDAGHQLRDALAEHLAQGIHIVGVHGHDIAEMCIRDSHSTLLCENFLRGMNEFKLKDLINAEAFAAPNWNGDLASLREDLDPLIAQGYAVTLFAGTPKGLSLIHI